MVRPNRGEVWIVDFGIAGKRRPVVVLSIALQDEDRVLAAIVPRTTQPAQTRFEVDAAPRLFNRAGVFDAQGLQAVPCSKFDRKIGELNDEELAEVEVVTKRWLGFVDVVGTESEERTRSIQLDSPEERENTSNDTTLD